MFDYLIYDENGNVLFTISTNSSLGLEDGAVYGSGFIKRVYDDTVHQFTLGLTYIKDGQVKERAAKPSVNHVWNNGSESWEVDIAKLKAEKVEEIKKACQNQIVGGFVSNAVGTEHKYPSEQIDQLNLSATVQRARLGADVSSELFYFLCQNMTTGEWGYVEHTAAQIEQVGTDAYNFILSARMKYSQLSSLIQSLETEAELNSITW